MTARTAFILGLFLLLAAVVRGGIYSAGHDFVVNRFTGRFQFVPAEDETEEQTPIGASRALTASRAKASFKCLLCGGTQGRAIRVGR